MQLQDHFLPSVLIGLIQPVYFFLQERVDCLNQSNQHSLLFSSGEGFNLSTMTSIVCFFCLFSLGYFDFSSFSSSRVIISPSNRILANPSCFNSSNSFSYVPFFD